MSSTPQTAQNPLFGRRWDIQILTNPDAGNQQTVLRIANDTFDQESPRCIFDVQQIGYQAFWYGDLTIYNLNAEAEQVVLRESQQVVVSAGYQKGNFGQIFKGWVFQPLWERENVVDYKITLHCLLGRPELTNNFVSFTHERFATQFDLIAKIAASARSPINIAALAQSMQQKQLPRGKVIFGNPGKYFNEAARDNNLQWFVGPKGLTLANMLEVSGTPQITYTPTTGLIGTPQQTQDGVSFKVLLDPRLQIMYPPMQVKIDQSAIRQIKRNIGDNVLTVLDRDGIYLIGGVRHIGDTRGQEWYTEVVGYTSTQGKLAAMMVGSGNEDPSAP